MPETKGGPDQHYVDAEGRNHRIYRASVDAATGKVLHPVSVPPGLVRADSAPPAPTGYKWQPAKGGRRARGGGAWVRDPDYTEPGPPDGEKRVHEGRYQVRVGGRWRNVRLRA